MARYPIRQPPEGYIVVYDPADKRYYPMKKKAGDTGESWEPFRYSDGMVRSYAKRAEAVKLCERDQQGEPHGTDRD
jgi:hypothetical protein